VTKENFRVCLEKWLTDLKKWDDIELANAEDANKIAKDLGLTGDDPEETSLKLSDLSGNTQPAPWAKGLSFVLLQVSEQLKKIQEPTLLMPWIFIPNGQAFHFIMVFQTLAFVMWEKNSLFLYNPSYSKGSLVYQMCNMLVPESDRSFIMGKYVSIDVIYVRHNRNVDPKEKSKVEDLTEYKMYDSYLSNIWNKLMDFPWLRKYVNLGKKAWTQLKTERWEVDVKAVRSSLDKLEKNEEKSSAENVEESVKAKKVKTLQKQVLKEQQRKLNKLNEMEVWLKEQSDRLKSEGIIVEGM